VLSSGPRRRLRGVNIVVDHTVNASGFWYPVSLLHDAAKLHGQGVRVESTQARTAPRVALRSLTTVCCRTWPRSR
jgi:hypothetical protein